MGKNKILELPIGERMKLYEAQYESKIEPENHIVVRIDGHKFSKYTKEFNKPFDTILSKAMELTTIDLVEEYQAVTGYTQSDEITLVVPASFTTKLKPVSYKYIETDDTCEYKVFDREDNYLGFIEAYFDDDEEGYGVTRFYVTDDDGQTVDQCSLQGRNPITVTKTEEMFSKYIIKEVIVTNQQIFGGRVQKMVSLIAGFTTMRFNKHLNDLRFNYYTDEMLKDLNSKDKRKYFETLQEKVGNAYFDCRMYGIESEDEVYNSVMWRVRDAEKNSRSMFAQTYCSHKQLQNMNGPTQVEFCKDTTGYDWEQIEDRYKYGILVKREKYMKKTNNPYPKIITMDVREVERTRTVSFTERLTMYSKENVDLVMRAHK